MTLSQTMRSRLNLLSVPKPVAIQITELVDKWSKHNGLEWTIQRLKDVKMFILHHHAGSVYIPTTWWRNKQLSGPFRYLLHLSKRDLSSALNAANCYTQFLSKDVTPTQITKFKNSVTALPPNLEAWPRGFRPLLRGLDKFDNQLPLPIYKYPLKSKGTTLENGIGIRENKLTVTRIEESLLYTRPIRKIWEDIRNPVLVSLCNGLETAFYNKDPSRSSNYIGRVHYIQEPGFKLRAIAIPHILLQKALDPLGEYLFGLLRTFPWDCTFDQSKGVIWCKQQFNTGHRLHSIDLSDATNYWPLFLQEQFLLDVGVNDHYLEVFMLAATGQYRLPDGKAIQWKRGQPLGLYPSFALFAASHGCFLKSLEAELGLQDSFRVLGDDVVISDDRLAKSYKKWLSVLGVPIASQKSFSSKFIGEFAGKIIFKNRKEPITVQKWRDINSYNVIDFLRVFGPKGMKLISRKWRDPLSRISLVPEPWGLGWNPNGLPLDQRLTPEVLETMMKDRTEYVSNKHNWAESELVRLTIERNMDIQGLSMGICITSVDQAEACDVDQTPLLLQESVLRENIPEYGVTRQELLGLGKPKPIPGQRAGDPRNGGKTSFMEIFRRWFGH